MVRCPLTAIVYEPGLTMYLHLRLFSSCWIHLKVIQSTHELLGEAVRTFESSPTVWDLYLDIIPTVQTLLSWTWFVYLWRCVRVWTYHMAALIIFMTHSFMHWHTLTNGAPRSPILPSSSPENKQCNQRWVCTILCVTSNKGLIMTKIMITNSYFVLIWYVI